MWIFILPKGIILTLVVVNVRSRMDKFILVTLTWFLSFLCTILAKYNTYTKFSTCIKTSDLDGYKQRRLLQCNEIYWVVGLSTFRIICNLIINFKNLIFVLRVSLLIKKRLDSRNIIKLNIHFCFVCWQFRCKGFWGEFLKWQAFLNFFEICVGKVWCFVNRFRKLLILCVF